MTQYHSNVKNKVVTQLAVWIEFTYGIPYVKLLGSLFFHHFDSLDDCFLFTVAIGQELW